MWKMKGAFGEPLRDWKGRDEGIVFGVARVRASL